MRLANTLALALTSTCQAFLHSLAGGTVTLASLIRYAFYLACIASLATLGPMGLIAVPFAAAMLFCAFVLTTTFIIMPLALLVGLGTGLVSMLRYASSPTQCDGCQSLGAA